MRLSKGELRLLKEIANGNRDIKNIASALKKSKAQTYRTGQHLVEQGFIQRSDGSYILVRSTVGNLLVQLLGDFPSLINPLSDSGAELLILLLEPKTVSEIIEASGMKKAQVFKKIKQARAISLARKVGDRYSLNEKLWAKAIDFLKELKKYQESTDNRVPGNSTIYYKNEKEIVFSNKEKIDATSTAFSAYEQYGIKILALKEYYYLPKKKLTKRQVFMHSLYIAEKEHEIRYLIFITLFYIKHKKELQAIKHPILDNLKNILEGNYLPSYPKLEEIQERAEMYDIKI